MWKDTLRDKCHKLKINLDESVDNKMLFFCSKELDDNTKIDLVGHLPQSMSYDFIVGPKRDTEIRISGAVQANNALPFTIRLKKDASIIVRMMVKAAPGNDKAAEGIEKMKENIWKEVDAICRGDGFFNSWRISIDREDRMFRPHVVSSNDGKRYLPISESDIKDLLIVLNTAKSFEEFIASI